MTIKASMTHAWHDRLALASLDAIALAARDEPERLGIK
jgi:hypothetical protein